jgi:hypothetical protein
VAARVRDIPQETLILWGRQDTILDIEFAERFKEEVGFGLRVKLDPRLLSCMTYMTCASAVDSAIGARHSRCPESSCIEINDIIYDECERCCSGPREPVPNSRLVWVEECGHVAHMEQPLKVRDALFDFANVPQPVVAA